MRIIDKILLYLDVKKVIKLTDKTFIKLLYKKVFEKKLNLDNPRTFNEKLQWLKIHDKNPEYVKMVDKFEVKKYVANIIGEEYIIPTLGIYDKFEEIDFEKLPNQFVIKCTHDSGSTIICKDKSKLDKKEIKEKITKCLKRNFYYASREWPYKNIKPRIIIERYMVDESNTELKDYKIFCFNGETKYIQVDFGRFNNHRRNIYDTNWNLTNLQTIYPIDKSVKIDKPKRLNDMLKLAEKLSKGKTFVRVDLYSIIDKVYFGELTFYPGGGLEKYTPEINDNILGDMLKLPIIRS